MPYKDITKKKKSELVWRKNNPKKIKEYNKKHNQSKRDFYINNREAIRTKENSCLYKKYRNLRLFLKRNNKRLSKVQINRIKLERRLLKVLIDLKYG